MSKLGFVARHFRRRNVACFFEGDRIVVRAFLPFNEVPLEAKVTRNSDFEEELGEFSNPELKEAWRNICLHLPEMLSLPKAVVLRRFRAHLADRGLIVPDFGHNTQ